MKPDLEDWVLILTGKKHLAHGRVHGGPNAGQVIGLIPYGTKIEDYFLKGDSPKATRLMEKESIVLACAKRSQAIKELSVKIESIEFEIRKSLINEQTRANIERMSEVTDMLTKNGDGSAAVDPIVCPVAPLKRKLQEDPIQPGEFPDQPHLKQLRADLDGKLKAIYEAHQTRYQVFEENVKTYRTLYAEAASIALKDKNNEHAKWQATEYAKKLADAQREFTDHAFHLNPKMMSSEQVHVGLGHEINENEHGIGFDLAATQKRIDEAMRVARSLDTRDLKPELWLSLTTNFLNGTTDRGNVKASEIVEAARKLVNYPPTIPTAECHPQFETAFAHDQIAKYFNVPTMESEDAHAMYKGLGIPVAGTIADGASIPTCTALATSLVHEHFVTKGKVEAMLRRVRDATQVGMIQTPNRNVGPIALRANRQTIPSIAQYAKGLEYPATQNAFTITFQAGVGHVLQLQMDQITYQIPYAYERERMLMVMIRGVDEPNEHGVVKTVAYIC
jgi:hypothetical protein